MRKDNWPQLLDSYIDAAIKRQFAYGAFDCALYCADWVEIATGIDYAKDLRGYASMLEAYKIIAKFGSSMEAMVTQLLGHEPMHAAWAQRGDIVLIRNPRSTPEVAEALGICLGRSAAFPSQNGLSMVPTLDCALSWKIR